MLPRIMVAPNGASRQKSDHPALPVTVPEIIETAQSCVAEGANGLHLHLRKDDGSHLLDAGAYREALQDISAALPDLVVQITTEGGGIYSPDHQQSVALNAGANLVSVSVREMLSEGDRVGAQAFYQSCADMGIAVQHILYDVDDFKRLEALLPRTMFEDAALQLIYVLGRYTPGQSSSAADLDPFVAYAQLRGITPDWMVCAFGAGETDTLLRAAQLGGKMRIGFENSLWHANGIVARDNADRVRALVSGLQAQGLNTAA